MEVALDAPALLVRGRDDPRSRFLHGLELRAHLRVQTRVDEGEACGRRDSLHELRFVPERRVVHENGERFAFVLDERHRAPRAVFGHNERFSLGIDILVALREPEPKLEGRILERHSELVAEIARGGLLEMDDELAHVHACESGTKQAPEERERQRGQCEHLPPEEINRVGGRTGREREHAVEHGAQRCHDRRQQERPQDPARPRRRESQLPSDEDDEDGRKHAVARNCVRVLQEVDDAVVRDDGDEAVVRPCVEVAQAPPTVVEEQGRERKRDGDDVGDVEECALETIRHAPRRVCQCDVCHEDIAELADEEEDSESEIVVAVPKLPREQREADGDHQRAETVVRSSPPGDETGDEE